MPPKKNSDIGRTLQANRERETNDAKKPRKENLEVEADKNRIKKLEKSLQEMDEKNNDLTQIIQNLQNLIKSNKKKYDNKIKDLENALQEMDEKNKHLKQSDDPDQNCGPFRRSMLINRSQSYNTYIKPYVSRLCDVLPLRDVDNILGPHRYTEHLFKFNGRVKNIGIFGEHHAMKNQPSFLDTFDLKRTLTINSFLKSLLLSDPKKVYDFYLETDFINKSKPTRDPEEDKAKSFLFN